MHSFSTTANQWLFGRHAGLYLRHRLGIEEGAHPPECKRFAFRRQAAGSQPNLYRTNFQWCRMLTNVAYAFLTGAIVVPVWVGGGAFEA